MLLAIIDEALYRSSNMEKPSRLLATSFYEIHVFSQHLQLKVHPFKDIPMADARELADHYRSPLTSYSAIEAHI